MSLLDYAVARNNLQIAIILISHGAVDLSQKQKKEIKEFLTKKKEIVPHQFGWFFRLTELQIDLLIPNISSSSEQSSKPSSKQTDETCSKTRKLENPNTFSNSNSNMNCNEDEQNDVRNTPN